MTAGNRSERSVLCEDFNASDTPSGADKFAITTSCALFDFAVYTLAMGTLAVLGVLGNAVSFVVLLRGTVERERELFQSPVAVGVIGRQIVRQLFARYGEE